ERADTHPRRERAPCGEQLPGLEHRTVRIAVERDEVIPRPDRIEAEPVDERDGLAELFPGRVLGRKVDAPMGSRGAVRRRGGRRYASFPVAAKRSASSSASSMAFTPIRSSSSSTMSGGATNSMFQRQKTYTSRFRSS